MGKWTPEYHDEVLNARVKSLVTGAITRAGLEKGEPTITYERFVEELDPGDSFTTSLFDCLVKEVADRSSRPTNERQYVSQRSIRALRNLATASQQFDSRHESRRHHRIVGLSDFLASDPEASSSGDERLNPTAEDVRVNSELYEAYNTNPSHMVFPFISRQPSRQSSPDHLSHRTVPSTRQNPVIPTSSSSRTLRGGSLSRQPSIRRPRRSRTVVDFDEFTTRRRSNYRDALLDLSEEASSSTSESLGDRRRNSARRFFPLGRRHGDISGNLEDPDLDYLLSLPSWLLPASSLRRGNERDEQEIPPSAVVIPAPDSISTRHPSPDAPDVVRPQASASSLPTPDHELQGMFAPAAAARYPTPGSAGEENS